MGSWSGSISAWEGEEGDIEGYRGKEKRYPQGPVCVVDGKSLPTTYCCVSESGSITAELLVGMLNHIELSGIFPCENDTPHKDDVIHAKGIKKSQEFAGLEMKVLALKEQNKTKQISRCL